MLEQEKNLPCLPKKYNAYDKRLKSCIKFLTKDLSYNEMEEILDKARYDFMSHLNLNLNRYQTYKITPEDALEHALYAITKSREKSRKTICACSSFRIMLRSCLCNCQQKIGYMVRKTA